MAERRIATPSIHTRATTPPGHAAVEYAHQPPLAEGSLNLRKTLQTSKVAIFFVSNDTQKAQAVRDAVKTSLTTNCTRLMHSIVKTPNQDLTVLHGNLLPDVLVFVLLDNHTDAELEALDKQIEAFKTTNKQVFVGVFYGSADSTRAKDGRSIATTSNVLKLSSSNMVRPAEEYPNIVDHLKFYEPSAPLLGTA